MLASKATYFLVRLRVDAEPDISLLDLIFDLGPSSILKCIFLYLSFSIEYFALRVSNRWDW